MRMPVRTQFGCKATVEFYGCSESSLTATNGFNDFAFANDRPGEPWTPRSTTLPTRATDDGRHEARYGKIMRASVRQRRCYGGEGAPPKQERSAVCARDAQAIRRRKSLGELRAGPTVRDRDARAGIRTRGR